MDYPKFSRKAPPVTYASLFHGFAGQATSVFFFDRPISVNKMATIYQHYAYGPYSHDAMRSLFRIFDKTLMPKLAL
jgi:hypothetical protein